MASCAAANGGRSAAEVMRQKTVIVRSKNKTLASTAEIRFDETTKSDTVLAPSTTRLPLCALDEFQQVDEHERAPHKRGAHSETVRCLLIVWH